MRHLCCDAPERRDFFTMRELFVSGDEPSLLAINDSQQNADDDYINRHRNEEVLDALLELVAVIGVVDARIITLDPAVIRRPQHLLPSDDDEIGRASCRERV